MRESQAASSLITILVNGDPLQIRQEITITDLLRELNQRPELVVVELNRNILKKEELPQTLLKAGDQVEIVHFVGGGTGAWKGRLRS